MNTRIFPPTYFFILLVLLVVAWLTFPIWKFEYFPFNLTGLLLIIFGAVLNVWADNLFKSSKTTVRPNEKPTNLVISGPFRISRHPMYLGMTAILIGVAILSQTLITFLFPILFVTIIEIKFIPVEESNLRYTFGERYGDYQAQVGKWI